MSPLVQETQRASLGSCMDLGIPNRAGDISIQVFFPRSFMYFFQFQNYRTSPLYWREC